MGGQIGLRAIVSLTGASLKETQAATDAVSNGAKGAGYTMASWADAQKDLNVKVDKFKAGLQVAGIEIGTKLLPVAGKLIDFFTGLIPIVEPALNSILAHLPPIVDALIKAGPIFATIGKEAINALRPIVAVLGFVSQHMDIVIAVVTAMTARWVLMNIAIDRKSVV